MPPSDDPEYRRDGTAAHEFAAACLTEAIDAWEVTCRVAENGVVCSVEMASAIQVYLDRCRSVERAGDQVFVEFRISSPEHEHFYGTVDHAVVSTNKLYVNDFKYGMGLEVGAERNKQIMYYALGLLLLFPDIDEVELCIIQPRGFAGELKVWNTTAQFIRDWARDELFPAMAMTKIDSEFKAGSWCRFCPAKLVCPLMRGLFKAATHYDPTELRTLNDEELAEDYRFAEVLQMFLHELKAETYRRLARGSEMSTAYLTPKKADRVWKPGAQDVFAQHYGEKVFTDPVLKSPAMMEKLPGSKSLIKEWAYMPDRGYSVAVVGSKKPRVKIQPYDPDEDLAMAEAYANME